MKRRVIGGGGRQRTPAAEKGGLTKPMKMVSEQHTEEAILRL